MNGLAYNYHGLGDPRAVGALRGKMKEKDPHLVFLEDQTEVG